MAMQAAQERPLAANDSFMRYLQYFTAPDWRKQNDRQRREPVTVWVTATAADVNIARPLCLD
jgi:hypothetical protein